MKNSYKKSLITYYDILGFSELVNTKSSEYIYGILNKFKKTSTNENEARVITTLNVSDTIIRLVYQIDESLSTDGNSTFFQEIINMSYIIHDLFADGILVRGGIVFDDVFWDKQFYFGPGIVNAYSIEKTAIYPRIVIDKNLLEELEIINGSTDGEINLKLIKIVCSSEKQINEIENILSYFKKDSDGEYYLDYLTLLEREYRNEYLFGQFLLKHKQIIDNGLDRFKNTPHIYEKYMWLRKYQNRAVLKFIWEERRGIDHYSSAVYLEDLGF
jgi:hypothetical protein